MSEPPPHRATIRLGKTETTVTLYSYRDYDLWVAVGALTSVYRGNVAATYQKRVRGLWVDCPATGRTDRSEGKDER